MDDNALAIHKGNGKALAWSSSRDLLAETDFLPKVEETVRKLMRLAPGGQRLTKEEATDLAVYSLMTDLNPFNSEAYYLPKVGPIAGVVGFRKKANEWLSAKYGPTARFWCEFRHAEEGEADFNPAKGDIAYHCTLHDSETKTQWEGRMIHNLGALKKQGMSTEEAWKIARELAGPEPVWTAVGKVDHRESFSFGDKPDKWDRHERAQKRAEKWAIRKAYPAVNIPDREIDGEVVEGIVREIPDYEERPHQGKGAAKLLTELGFDPEPGVGWPESSQPEPDPEPEIDTIFNRLAAQRIVDSPETAERALSLRRSILPESSERDLAAWLRVWQAWVDAGESEQNAANKSNTGERPR
jgi:hypothetical protein